MKAKNISLKLTLILIIFTVIFAAVVAGISLRKNVVTAENALYDVVTTIKEPDGKETEVYCSGNQYFNYMHDASGNILMLDDFGYLKYAKDDGNGRPIPSFLSASREATVSDLILNSSKKMQYEDIDFNRNPDLLTNFPRNDDINVLNLQNNSAPSAVSVNNYIIFILFSGETTSNYPTSSYDIVNSLNAYDNSLKSYFYDVSSGLLTVNSVTSLSDSEIIIYQDSHSRKYFEPYHYFRNPIGYSGDTARGAREAVLLTNAVNHVSPYLTGTDADIDNDGMVDSVTFIIYGTYNSSSWNTLLWPHSWNLKDINSYYNNNASAKINGVNVGDFTFHFSEALTTGVLCHEFGHVLGAPDLYHYNQKDYVPVGEWDLMGMDLDTPQYMTAYIRDKYLGFAGETQIQTISSSGVYTLKPVTDTASYSSDVFAYKIAGKNSYEYFMVEYRTAESTGVYDDELPSNGLIIYRININAEDGNREAVYKDPDYPDEVFMFRPTLPTAEYLGYTDTYTKSMIEAWHSALSPENEYFSSVGVPLSASVTSYSNKSVYYTDGTNSGITVTTLFNDENEIKFFLSVPSTSSDYQNILNKVFIDSVTQFNGETSVDISTLSGIDFSLFSSVKLKFYDSGLNVIGENEIRNDLIENYYGSSESKFTYKLNKTPYKAELLVTTATGTTLKQQFNSISEATISSMSVNDYKTDYVYNEPLDKSVGTVTLTTSSGDNIIVPLDSDYFTFTAFDSTVFAPQTVTVSYLPTVSAQMTVQVIDQPSSLLVSGTKCYLSGDTLNLNVSVVWLGGAVSPLSAADYDCTYEGEPFTTTGKAVGEYPLDFAAEVTGSITKNLSGSFTVWICEPAESLDVYYTGGALLSELTVNSFNFSPLNIEIKADGTEDVTDSANVSYNPLTVNSDQTLTVSYLGLVKTYTINISDYILNIEYQGEAEFLYGADFLGNLKFNYASGVSQTQAIPSENILISGYNKNVLGAQTVTLSYSEVTTTVNINVKDYLSEVNISDFSLSYNIGDTLSDQYNLTYTTASGVNGNTTVLKEAFVGFNSETSGVKTVNLSVNIEGCETYKYTLSITVIDPVISLQPTQNIKIYDIIYGRDFNLELYAVRKSGASKLITSLDYTVSGFDKFTMGEQLATVSYIWDSSYDAVTLDIEVCVHDKVTSLKIDTATNSVKTTYAYGEALNLKGVIFKAITATADQIILIDENGILRENVTLSPYDPTYVGAQKITLAYEGLSVYYYINVKSKTADFIKSESLSIDKSRKYIYVSINTTLEQLLTNITFESSEMTLNGEAGNLKTGESVYIKNGSLQTVDIFTVIVKGDLNGDGLITEGDIEILANYITGKTKTNAAVVAADMDESGTVNINDYVLMRKIMLEAEEK